MWLVLNRFQKCWYYLIIHIITIWVIINYHKLVFINLNRLVYSLTELYSIISLKDVLHTSDCSYASIQPSGTYRIQSFFRPANGWFTFLLNRIGVGFLTYIDWTPHNINTSSAIHLTDCGITIESKTLHHANALYPILSTVLGIVIEFSFSLFCWGSLPLCLSGILICNFIFLYCPYLVFVSG